MRVAPVSTFLMVTATSGRAAPVWFVTTPERLAPVWAHAAPSMQRKATIKARATAMGRYFTSLSPSMYLFVYRTDRAAHLGGNPGAHDFRRFDKRCQTALIRFAGTLLPDELASQQACQTVAMKWEGYSRMIMTSVDFTK